MTVVVAVAAGVEALRHRAVEAGSDSLPVAVPMIALALTPLLLDALAGHDKADGRGPRSRFFLPRPLWAALMIFPVIVVLIDSPTDTDFAPFILVLMCIQAGAVARLAEGIAITAVASLALVVIELTTSPYGGAFIWVFGNYAAWCGGFAVQKSLVLVHQEKERHAEQMAGAAVDERRRIAREVHDVIAHSLSVTMLHLTGARRALETGADPGEAAEALRDAERLGRQAMNDIRRTVGLLAPEASGETAPMPTIDDIPSLVGEFSSAGLNVTSEVNGDPTAVPLATGLGLYRIAQESLSNVAKHAPGSAATVAVDVSDHEVGLAIRNSGANGAAPLTSAPDVGGLGLRGMEERARLLGARFRAGPDADGWSVVVAVPRDVDPDLEPPPARGRQTCG